MRIYLDTSVYNRPFDDQTQPRIWLESLAFVIVLQMIKADQVELVSSSILEYENSQNPFVLRKRWVNRCLELATRRQNVNEKILARAQELENKGLKAIDSLHIASAKVSESQYFLTCDDKMIKRYEGSINVLNPVDFVLSSTGEQP